MVQGLQAVVLILLTIVKYLVISKEQNQLANAGEALQFRGIRRK